MRAAVSIDTSFSAEVSMSTWLGPIGAPAPCPLACTATPRSRSAAQRTAWATSSALCGWATTAGFCAVVELCGAVAARYAELPGRDSSSWLISFTSFLGNEQERRSDEHDDSGDAMDSPGDRL